jgi:predicted deacylase
MSHALPFALPLDPQPGGLALHGWRFTSGKPGPKILLTGALHGDEITATAALWHLTEHLRAHPPARGEVTLIPCANPFGAQLSSRNVPLENTNMNRVFPGLPDGTLAERTAHRLARLLDTHDALIDVHTAGWCVPFVIIDPIADPGLANRTLAWATTLGWPVTGELPGPNLALHGLDRCWTGYALSRQKPAFVLELVGFHTLDGPCAREAAHRLAHTLPQFPLQAPVQSLATTRTEVYAERSGLFEALKRPGDALAKYECVGVVYNLSSGDIVQRVAAPADGLLLYVNPVSAVQVGGHLFTQTQPVAR